MEMRNGGNGQANSVPPNSSPSWSISIPEERLRQLATDEFGLASKARSPAPRGARCRSRDNTERRLGGTAERYLSRHWRERSLSRQNALPIAPADARIPI